MQPYPSLSHCDAASRDTEEGRRTRWCRRESASNQSAQSRHAALSCTTMWQPRRKRRPEASDMDAKPDALTALCRGSSSGLAAGGECGHPRCQLLSPSSNFSHAGADGILKTRSPPLFASCRWHHNSKANARHVSAFLCVPLSILTSPHQVVPKYISLDTGISRRLNMPAATSPTSLLVPLFCPTFFLPELQRTAQCQSVLPTYPSHKPPSHMVLLPFQTLLQDTVLYPTPPAEPNRRDPSSLCAGVLVYLAWAADLFENHRIFSHLSRDLHHTSGVKTAPILKTGN